MRRRSPHDADGPHRAGTLTGQCDHCPWHTVEDSYPAVVKAYQDHLRETHPQAWVRG